MRGRSILATQFLRRNNEGYFIELLGKNGEPKKGFIANLSFSLNNFHRNVEKILQTNAEGRIKLGPLTGVRRVASSITPQGDISVEKLNVDLTELS